MFEEMRSAALAGLPGLGARSDAEVMEAISAHQRMQSVHAAAQLAAIADMQNRYEHAYDAGIDKTAIDRDELLAMEVGAALNISRGRALRMVDIAVDLRDRLPHLGAALAAGDVDMRLVNTIHDRALIVTDELIGQVDAALASLAGAWSHFSVGKIIDFVDAVIAEIDPGGVRNRREMAEKGRHVGIDKSRDGAADLWGSLLVEDGVALDARLEAMARSVCKGDPRTLENRRADALGALARGESSLACQCDDPACPARASKGPNNVVVHVIAEEATLTGTGNRPGYVLGLGPIDADLTRRVAGVPESPFLPKRKLTDEQHRQKCLREEREAQGRRRFAEEVERRFGCHRQPAGP